MHLSRREGDFSGPRPEQDHPSVVGGGGRVRARHHQAGVQEGAGEEQPCVQAPRAGQEEDQKGLSGKETEEQTLVKARA